MRKSQPGNDHAPHFITIFESELQAISWLTEQWKGKEVGGCLYGLLTHANRIIIYLALGPGPNAIHREAFFQQDFEFFTKVNRIIRTFYGLLLSGFHHSHPSEFDHPSGPDDHGVISMTSKNGAKRWCNIIANNISTERLSFSSYWSLQRKNMMEASSKIKISAYEYIDPKSGRNFPAKILVIPGTSPFRLYALARGDLDDVTLCGFNTKLSSQNIIYDRFDPESLESPVSATDLAGLSTQLKKLPPHVQEKIELSNKENLVIITLPTLTGRKGHIAVDDTAPHKVRAVYVKDSYSSKPVDVTDQVLVGRRSVQLLKAYEHLNSGDIHLSAGIDTYGYRPDHQSFEDEHQDSLDEVDHNEAHPEPQDRSKRGQDARKNLTWGCVEYSELLMDGGNEDEDR